MFYVLLKSLARSHGVLNIWPKLLSSSQRFWCNVSLGLA